jgi:hypothetical protein
VLKKLILFCLCVAFAFLLNIFINQVLYPYTPTAGSVDVPVELDGGGTADKSRHRVFTIHKYPAKLPRPKAVILFGSGDGGWLGWEDTMGHNLQNHGYTVMGIDCNDYAATDYDLATMQADYATIARAAMKDYPWLPPPLIIGGWSMGAGQAIAVAGGPNRPPGLTGLLLISPCSRGRYGVRVADRLDILPKGPGTFAVADFIPGMEGLRILQWHGEGDTVDSTAWLADLKVPHEEHDFPKGNHDYAGCSPEFQQQLGESVEWITNPNFSLEQK